LPTAHEAEIAAEQRILDAAYARLDAMRLSAARVADAYSEVRRGGTHQARLERDIAVETTHRRLAALDIGDAPLCFGRLDLASPRVSPTAGPAAGNGDASGAIHPKGQQPLREPGDHDGIDRAGTIEQDDATDHPRYYIGRLSVDDDDHRPVVVDWRAPVAEPFYRATAVEPMGVVRRRHFITRHGRELIGLDDEVFDAAAAGEGLTIVGEAALLAALERERTGRMHDIVATIQAEQDEAIRADLDGVLVVAGGPGTGKTAVALHRAAYLLYTYRRRLAGDGVLLIGPNPVFLRYIDQVLPSLGEDDVHLSTIASLKPGLRVTRRDVPGGAAVKGDRRMATVIANAVSDREHPLPRDITVPIDGLRLPITRRDSRMIVERARRRHGLHNARRPFVAGLLLDHLVARYRRATVRAYRESFSADAPQGQLVLDDGESLLDPTVAGALSRGDAPPEGWESDLRARFRRVPEFREALERMWPVLSGAELVHDLFSFIALIRSAADNVLTRDEQAGLHRQRAGRVHDVAWSEGDVALVDEADALLGPVESARPGRGRRRGPSAEALDTAARVVAELGLDGQTSAQALAERFADGGARNGGDSIEPRTYGHILVDEAQDLTAMEWRMLARRSTSGSMTLVGDFGQASRPGAAGSWDEVVTQVSRRGRGRVRVVNLAVNYRTPAEVMTVANRVLAVASPGIEPTTAVRATGEHPRFLAARRDDDADLVRVAADAAREAVGRRGTTAVIAPADLHGGLVAALGDVGAVADRAEAIDAPVAVLEPLAAKGLEFDHVVVVEPARLVTPDPPGLRLLYVTLTRATRDLTVVHSAALPEALQDR
jgi:DNA helicase IV